MCCILVSFLFLYVTEHGNVTKSILKDITILYGFPASFRLKHFYRFWRKQKVFPQSWQNLEFFRVENQKVWWNDFLKTYAIGKLKPVLKGYETLVLDQFSTRGVYYRLLYYMMFPFTVPINWSNHYWTDLLALL